MPHPVVDVVLTVSAVGGGATPYRHNALSEKRVSGSVVCARMTEKNHCGGDDVREREPVAAETATLTSAAAEHDARDVDCVVVD